MSEPKLISPLLDGFAMGAPMSSHDGVQCCPAMKENSDNKYIVKIISVPASQRQLDALLLTGAYASPQEATDYFKEVADGIVKEAALLKKLSRLEGFLPYEDWQIVPMEDNDTGFDVYLYGTYRQSLEKFTHRNLMTHLGAVNLGLDLCAALAICRRAGRIYVDLKPTNIFISEDKEYRIGDLGFAEMANLKYTSLPAKYCSAYTAPELKDPMNTLNTTADTYAVGMILYQIYNNGQLPQPVSEENAAFPTPENADYEIAEIIMQAIAPNPDDRWSNPIEMGRALVAYMQRNTVNDVPITPPTATVSEFTPLTGQERDQPAAAPEPTGSGEFDFMSGIVSDETAPGEEDVADAQDRPLSPEATSMLAQADDLIDREVPAGVTVPETVEIPEPAPVAAVPEQSPKQETEPEDDFDKLFGTSESDDEEDEEEDEDSGADDADDFDDDDEDDGDEDDDAEEASAGGKKKHRWIAPLIIILILALLLGGGYFFYRNYYLVPIDSLDVAAHESQATVTLTTAADESLLSVVCTDIYGNVQRLPVSGGKAVFTDLLPDTQYKIQLEVEGFHSLTGSTGTSFSTPAVTTVSGFSAVTGDLDGSVVLSFETEGPGTEEWIVTYKAEDQDAKSVPFTGNTVTITDLEVGTAYHFVLSPAVDIFLTGERTLDFTASAIILAEDLVISQYGDGSLTAQWAAPEGAEPEGWIVRCYTEDGQSETMEVTDTTATFSGIDTAKAYTVEVTAKGMSQCARTHVSANPTTLTGFHAEESKDGKLVLTWEYAGSYPEEGWLVIYTADGIEKEMVINTDGARAEIDPCVPGTSYAIEIRSVSGSSVFNGNYSYETAEAVKFEDYEMLVDFSDYYLCKTPEDPNWKYSDVKTADYTTSFASGDSVSMIIKTATHFIPRDQVTILFAIKDENGNLLCEYSQAETVNWYQLWVDYYPYTTLDIPQMPREAGTYQLCLYFNNKYVTVIEFTITE